MGVAAISPYCRALLHPLSRAEEQQSYEVDLWLWLARVQALTKQSSDQGLPGEAARPELAQPGLRSQGTARGCCSLDASAELQRLPVPIQTVTQMGTRFPCGVGVPMSQLKEHRGPTVRQGGQGLISSAGSDPTDPALEITCGHPMHVSGAAQRGCFCLQGQLVQAGTGQAGQQWCGVLGCPRRHCSGYLPWGSART